MRSPVFRRPGCRRHAGTTKRRPQYATPEAVAGCHCTTRPCGTQDDTHRTTAEAQPRTTSGVRLCTGAIWHAPHVATTPRGEIRGFAQLPPPAGVAEMHASGHHRRRGGTISPYERHKVMAQDRHNGMAASAESHEVACLSITLHLRCCAGLLARCPPQLRAEGTPLATLRPDLRCTSAESRLSWRWIAHGFSRCGALF